MSGAGWSVEHHRGSADQLHALAVPDPASRAIWVLEVVAPAVVLGSRQPLSTVDAVRARAAGVEVATRRSGGAAVWLDTDVVWVDVIVPRGDPHWSDDIGRAAHWMGSCWRDALLSLGAAGLAVHDGAMVHRAWSDLVCFAGLGPGEVTVGGAKLVGISQRRTRAGARFQCAVHRRWDPAPLLEVLAPESVRSGGDLDALFAAGTDLAAVGIDATTDALVDALRRAAS